MSVELLVLECIRGADLDEVARTITAALESTGWVAVSGGDNSRHIHVVEEGQWIVVDDRWDSASTRWAATLSEELGGTALGLRYLEGESLIERFDDGSRKGKVRNVRGHASTSFLADLGKARSRAKLKAGLDFDSLDGAALVRKVAALTELPELRTFATETAGGLNLFFRLSAEARPRAPRRTRVEPKSAPVEKAQDASMRLVHVGHVRGVSREELFAAMRDVLGKRSQPQMFVTSDKAWHSFGRAVPSSTSRLETPPAKTDDLALVCAELSASLDVPVLEVLERKASTTLTVWHGGKKAGELVLRGDVAAVDASLLAAFAPKKARALRAVDLDMSAAAEHQFVAIWLAQEIGLERAILLGSFDGTMISRAG